MIDILLIFPAKRINGNPTINAIRGMHGWIRDRFDLTLECIRRWYVGEDNPLFKDLDRYKSYLELFVNFKGYIDFFLLNDLIDIDYKVKFWLPFLDFGITQPLPRDIKEYREYMINVKVFVEKRNQRIKA